MVACGKGIHCVPVGRWFDRLSNFISQRIARVTGELQPHHGSRLPQIAHGWSRDLIVVAPTEMSQGNLFPIPLLRRIEISWRTWRSFCVHDEPRRSATEYNSFWVRTHRQKSRNWFQEESVYYCNARNSEAMLWYSLDCGNLLTEERIFNQFGNRGGFFDANV